jgi:tight adherence protein B
MDTFMLIVVFGGGAVLILLLIGLVLTRSQEQVLVEKRLDRYIEEEFVPFNSGEKGSPVGDWLNSLMEGSNWGAKKAKDLARADIKLRPAEYLALMVIAAFGVGIITWYLTGQNLVNGILGAIGGLFLPGMYVKREQGRRLQRFNDQLADMLGLMVNGLRAGYSVMQAMEAVSREMPAPISDEFRRVVQEMQLGISMEAALDNLLRRIPSDDLDLTITAINVQREVGGNLAEILDTITYTIRERVRVKGEIRVMTSQVMYSGRFLSLMPFLIAGVLFLMNRSYMMEFFNPETRLPGIIALSIAGLMIGMGYVVMNKIATIDV